MLEELDEAFCCWKALGRHKNAKVRWKWERPSAVGPWRTCWRCWIYRKSRGKLIQDFKLGNDMTVFVFYEGHFFKIRQAKTISSPSEDLEQVHFLSHVHLTSSVGTSSELMYIKSLWRNNQSQTIPKRKELPHILLEHPKTPGVLGKGWGMGHPFSRFSCIFSLLPHNSSNRLCNSEPNLYTRKLRQAERG